MKTISDEVIAFCLADTREQILECQTGWREEPAARAARRYRLRLESLRYLAGRPERKWKEVAAYLAKRMRGKP